MDFFVKHKISAVAAGIIFLVARIVDAVIDLFMGIVVDRTHSRWGKFRPYILFGALPLTLMGVLCFTTPVFTGVPRVAYACATYMLLMVCYSVVSIPYTSMTAAMSTDAQERVSITTYPQFFGMLGTAIVAVATVPLVTVFGGNNLSKGYQSVMILFGVIALALYALMFFNVKERVTMKRAEAIPMRLSIQSIASNKPLLLLIGFFVFGTLGSTIRSNLLMYYFTYSVGNQGLVSFTNLIMVITLLVSIPLVPAVTKRIDKKATLIIGVLLMIIAALGQFLTGYHNIPMIFVWSAILGFGSGWFVTLSWSMLPDTVEYAQAKTGVRAEGIIYSTFTFAQTAATGIAAAFSGASLTWIGYKADAAQSAFTLNGISFIYNIATALFLIIGILFILFYKLDRKMYNQILDKISTDQGAEMQEVN